MGIVLSLHNIICSPFIYSLSGAKMFPLWRCITPQPNPLTHRSLEHSVTRTGVGFGQTVMADSGAAGTFYPAFPLNPFDTGSGVNTAWEHWSQVLDSKP
jgi:hypothetical protein